MGTWGTGNFDNDGALDYVNEQIDSLAQRIEEILADSVLSRLDEDGETILMPSVVMISLLIEHCHGVPRENLPVSAWQARYLSIYDTQIANLEPDETYKLERRRTIEETFTRLDEQVQRLWHDKSGEHKG